MGNTAGISTGKKQKYYQSNAVGKEGSYDHDDVSLPSVAVISTPSPTNSPVPHAQMNGNGRGYASRDRPPSQQAGPSSSYMHPGNARLGNARGITMEVERRDPGFERRDPGFEQRDPGFEQENIREGRVKESLHRRSIDMENIPNDGEEVLRKRVINMSADATRQGVDFVQTSSPMDTAKFHSMQEIKQFIIENPDLMSGRLKIARDVHGIDKYKRKPKQVKTKQNTYLDLIHPSMYRPQVHSHLSNPKLNVGVVYPPAQQQEHYMNPRQAPPLGQVKVDQQEYLNYIGPKMDSYKYRKPMRAPQSGKYATDGNGNLVPSKEGILKSQSAYGRTLPSISVEQHPDEIRQDLGTLQSRRSTDTIDGRKNNRKAMSNTYVETQIPQGNQRDKKSG